jgi:PPM family protein phosphatase
MAPLLKRILICLKMNPESIYYLFEAGKKVKQEDYIWPIAGKATVNDKVFIVCDGAGNFNNGEIASKLICQFMAAKVSKFGEQKMSGELINELLIEARDRLISYAREYRLDTDLSTTFSMLILYDQRALMSWYGDSRIYHLRGGEILFRTKDNSLVSEPIQNTAIALGIKADSSPIYAETKWIESVQDGDYFLLCSKGLIENVTDDDIKLMVTQNDKSNIDLTGSFRRLAIEKTPDNYSMYLIKIKVGTQKWVNKGGITAIGKQNTAFDKQNIAIKKQTIGIREQIIEIREKTNGNVTPIAILAMTIVGLLIMVIYFRNARPSAPVPVNKKQTTQPADVLHEDSIPSAFVISTHRKSTLTVTDSVIKETVQDEEKPEQANQSPTDEKKRVAQLLIKLTTDESCKLKITNIDLDEVFDWDLSQDDDGTIYLKPGKYSIIATSVINNSKTKTYNFDVKPGNAHTTQNLHISF